jgi:anti-sigma factor RsiW
VTCDDVRDLLPEHLLGTLEPDADRAVREHLRGCAACRAEADALGEGIAGFARAAHDREPPPELRERVLTVLEEEWRDSSPAPGAGRRWVAVAGIAAAVALLVVSIGFAVSADRRADLAQAGADSYERLLDTLGGKEFRIGEIASSTRPEVEGSVVLYDSHQGQSWGVVLVRAPGWGGTATATLEAPDGRTIDVGELEFADDGDAATWIVTGSSLEPYDHLTIVGEDGSELAGATIEDA